MRLVDLTLPINRHMAGIPGMPLHAKNPPRCVVLSAVNDAQLEKIIDQGLEVEGDPPITGMAMLSRLEILGHTGTHIDAPIHFVEEGWSIDQVPLDRLVKPGRIIPLTHMEPGEMVTADKVLATGVDFDETVIPVLHTGWTDRTWGTDAFWDDMICLDTSVSELMVERNVSAMALDFFPEVAFWKMDGPPPGGHGPNHEILLSNQVILIQMLTNIKSIGTDEFTLVAMPLALENMDGSPARIIAMVD